MPETRRIRELTNCFIAAFVCLAIVACGGGSVSNQASTPAGTGQSSPSSATAKTLSAGMRASALATAASVILGSAAEGSGTDTITDTTGAYINASRFKAQSSGSITALYAKVGAITGGYRVAVYSDANGQPGSLLSASVEVSPKAAGWVAFALAAAVPVQADIDYWLAIWSNDTAASVSATAGSGVLRWGKYSYRGTWPTPLNLSDGANLQYAIYAVGATQQTAPTVALTSPAAGTTFVAPASVTLSASASDDGGIAKVEFFNGVTKLGESTAAPYVFNWTNVAGGAYTVLATATNNNGLVASASANIKVATVVTGSTGEGNVTDIITDGSGAYINANRLQVASSSTISAIYAKVGAISGNYKVAIYSDVDGNPGSLLASSGDVSPKSTGWTSFALSAPVTVNGGSAYWMAIWSSDTAARVFAITGSGTLRWGKYSYANSWPTPLNLTGSGTATQYSMYAVTVPDTSATPITNPDPTPTPDPTPSPTTDPTSPAPAPISDTPASRAEAARFLNQATFGATSDSIDHLMALGSYSKWFDEQFVLPRGQTYSQWWTAASKDQLGQLYMADQNDSQISAWMSQAVQDQAQLRQRMIFALSQIVVASKSSPTINSNAAGNVVFSHAERLATYAFGNYRDLLQSVSRSAVMGSMLSFGNNERENYSFTGSMPDQNYAREIMQLFTIGLYELNPDGTQKLVGGQPVRTYSADDIVGLSKVFTGFMIDQNKWDGDLYVDENRHSCSEKKFLGAVIDAGRPVPAPSNGKPAGDCSNAAGKSLSDLSSALNTLFNHPNVGPFIGRNLIQRFTTSNPSAAYVGRVAAKFNDNGKGVRGDLSAVVRQILLDPEARSLPSADTGGKIREPGLRTIQLMRVLNHKFPDGRVWSPANIGNCYYYFGITTVPDQLGFDSPGVFNYYRPGFSPAGSRLVQQNLVAPEMQTTDTLSVVEWSKFLSDSLRRDGAGLNSRGPNNHNDNGNAVCNGGDGAQNTFDYSSLMTVAGTTDSLVAQLNTLLTGDQLSAATQASLKRALNGVVGTGDAQKKNRIKLGIYLTMLSPDYILQK